MSYVGTSAAGNLVTAKGTGIPASFLPPGSLSGLSGILLGNNLSAFTAVALINNGTFITSNAGVPSFLTNGTTGQVLTATAGSPPTWANPTTSVGIWTDEATSFSAVAGNGYFITAASVVATLPASPTQGQTIAFASDSATASSLTITASAGQVIRLGTTASAAAGTAVNTQRGDSITLVYRTSDTTWIATQAIGSWNVT